MLHGMCSSDLPAFSTLTYFVIPAGVTVDLCFHTLDEWRDNSPITGGCPLNSSFSLISASYGRSTNSTCNPGVGPSSSYLSSCYVTDIKRQVLIAPWCMNNWECGIYEFVRIDEPCCDPCPQVRKYVELVYRCS